MSSVPSVWLRTFPHFEAHGEFVRACNAALDEMKLARINVADERIEKRMAGWF